MDKLSYEELQQFISLNVIRPFNDKRLQKINSLSLNMILKRKNPYLFKAKNIQTSEELIKYILDAFLSSQEETIFGNLMEDLAIFVCQKTFNGYKAQKKRFKSVDLIFKKDNKTFIVGIKSGTSWGNSDQIDRMKNSFKEARQILRDEGVIGEIIAINGCMYGRDLNSLKTDSDNKDKNYYKLCGQDFWELISGDSKFYQRIVVPIDKEAKKHDEIFKKSYSLKINEMTKKFSQEFLASDDSINWEAIIDFVSKNNTGKSTELI